MTRFQSSLLFLTAVVLGFAVLGAVALAWTNPTQNPPNGNVTSQWTVSGSDIYRTSNVAIGTTATSSQLHVFNSTGDNILKLSRGASTSTILRIGTDGALVVQNQSSDVLTIKSGNVGIGTTGPTYKLQVANGAIVSDYPYEHPWGVGIRIGSGWTGGWARQYAFYSDAGTQMAGFYAVGAGNTINRVAIGQGLDSIGEGPSWINIIPNTGNVGIGTTGPLAKLHVNTGGTSGLSSAANRGIIVTNDIGARLTLENTSLAADQKVWVIKNDSANLSFAALNDSGSAWIGDNLVNITRAGNVGIGTTGPQRKLQIGDDAAGIGLEPTSGSPNAGYLRFGDNTGWKFHVGRSRESSGGSLNTGTTGVLMTIQDNGNVGIGTTGPNAKLHVVGAELRLQTDNSFYSQYNTAGSRLGYLQWNSSTGNLNLVNEVSGQDLYLTTTGSGADVIVNNGNVGIGTTSPGAKLQVVRSDTTLGEAIKIYKGSDADQAWLTWSQGSEASGVWRAGFTGFPYDLRFSVGTASSLGTEVMRLTTSGNVGIGTTSPGRRLFIDGNTDEWTSIGVRTTGAAYSNLELYRANGTKGSPTNVAVGNGLGALVFYGYRNGTYSAGASIMASVAGGFDGSDMPANLYFYTVPDNSLSGVLRMTIADNGNITFSNYTAGNCCSDIAEYYPSSEPVEAADVVAVDLKGTGGTVKKAQAGDTVIGIVSTNPAIAIEEQHLVIAGGVENYVGDPMKPVIALAGRVPVKVSLENGPIRVGDRLTASSVPGVAMKAVKAGMTVGVALEPLENIASGSYAKISAFVNVGYWMPEGK